MDTFKIDYENLDVDAIMAQVRQRVNEKKGLLYSEADLANLGSLELPSPLPPERQDPDRDRIPVPDMPEIPPPSLRTIAPLEQKIARSMRSTRFEDVQHDDFVTEALRCVGEWNINVSLEDLYKSSPSFKGKMVRRIRNINRKLFKLVMNIDVLFPQFHRQAILNQTYVQLFHTLVRELSDLLNRVVAGDRDLRTDLDNVHRDLHQLLRDNIRDLSADIARVDADLKQTRGELMRDMANDKNDFMRAINSQDEVIKQLHYKVDNLRGLIEGQKQQIEYLTLRQRALEKLAVLREETKEEAPASGELEPGRYQPDGEKKRMKGA